MGTILSNKYELYIRMLNQSIFIKNIKSLQELSHKKSLLEIYISSNCNKNSICGIIMNLSYFCGV